MKDERTTADAINELRSLRTRLVVATMALAAPDPDSRTIADAIDEVAMDLQDVIDTLDTIDEINDLLGRTTGDDND